MVSQEKTQLTDNLTIRFDGDNVIDAEQLVQHRCREQLDHCAGCIFDGLRSELEGSASQFPPQLS